jgi:hypothetical protein
MAPLVVGPVPFLLPQRGRDQKVRNACPAECGVLRLLGIVRHGLTRKLTMVASI